MTDDLAALNTRLLAGEEVTAEQCQAATRAAVREPGRLVRADPPVRVEVWDAWAGGWFPGLVTAWRGGRVNVTYSRGPGMRHLVWLPAEAVRRVEKTGDLTRP